MTGSKASPRSGAPEGDSGYPAMRGDPDASATHTAQGMRPKKGLHGRQTRWWGTQMVVSSEKRSPRGWPGCSLPGSGGHRTEWASFLHTPTPTRLRPHGGHTVLHPLTCRPLERHIYSCTSVFCSPICLFEVHCLHCGRIELRPRRLVGVGAKRKRCGAQKCCVNTGSERLIFYYL